MNAGTQTIALVVAAGSGSRLGGGVPKQFRKIAGTPLLVHTLDRLQHPAIDQVRVVIGEDHRSLYQAAVGVRSVGDAIVGGQTRRQSVRNGLEAISADGGAARILIHDAARPWVRAELIDRLLGSLADHAGAVPALAVADTLARSEDGLGEVVDRDGLFRIQTPQAFRFDVALDAHRLWSSTSEPTDDAQMVRAAGHAVALVEGDPQLDKLTFPADFAAAERRLAACMVSRTGLGFDVHALTPGEPLWLGGVLIPHSHGLKGHSDADVGLHALTDALLGAAGEGDIGVHFPPSDARWRGADSARFLAYAAGLIGSRGGIIDHVDLTLICEAPKIGPYRDAIRHRVGELLGLPGGRVSIKATTTERLGFTGRAEGIAAQAVATVRLPEAQ